MNRRHGFALLALLMLLPACGERSLRGMVRIDGSSTVYPISEAVAEEFMRSRPGQARITLGVSGTGGGLRKFCRGESDITNASRPITRQEIASCAEAGIDFIELPIALDAITVVVHPDNHWAEELDLQQLRRAWAPESQGVVTRWQQIDPAFPDLPLHLFGAGSDSGTFEYFTEAVVGTARSSRGDFTASEDDNVLVSGVAQDRNALGYFGYAYYRGNTSRLKAVRIRPSADEAGVAPSAEAARDGSYRPLSRAVFIYVSLPALTARPEVGEFVAFYIDHAAQLVDEVGFISLPQPAYASLRGRFAARRVGSLYGGDARIGERVDDLLSVQPQ